VPPSALGMLIVAAVLHASWNLIVKQAQERQIFTWWSLVIGSLCFLPLLAFGPSLPGRVWPYVLASAIAETAYFFALIRAYRIGDFSLVYPIARGTAPAFLAIWAALFLGERPNHFGLLGIGILVGGLIIVGSGAWLKRQGPVQVSSGAIAAALLVALCISIYTAIDGAAVRIASPISYTVAILGLSAIFATPAILVRYPIHAIQAEWQANWPRIIAVGILNLGTYMLVLAAYSRARVGYAGAVRELSVVVAALIGWRFLGEPFGAHRTLGSILIFAGIIVIAALG
jgi:drug/metabolite transporter (DMT)-like permease